MPTHHNCDLVLFLKTATFTFYVFRKEISDLATIDSTFLT